jgi:hypothetical protein
MKPSANTVFERVNFSPGVEETAISIGIVT